MGNQVQPMLKKLSTESSLLSAITPAFKKPLADRGPFDIMAIEGAEGIFTKHLEGLQEQIDKADETKADKLSTETASQDTLKDAKEKYTASEDALKAAEEVLASLEAKMCSWHSVHSRSSLSVRAVHQNRRLT